MRSRNLYIGGAMMSLLLLALNLYYYDEMLDYLPTMRGKTIEKTYFWATRIQIINLLSLFAVLILCNALQRLVDFSNADIVSIIMIITTVLKTAIEFMCHFDQAILDKSGPMLAVIVAGGLGVAMWKSKSLVSTKRWRNLRFRKSEKIALVAIAIIYVSVNTVALAFFVES